MERWKILAFKHFSFTDDSGAVINGTRLFASHECPKQNWVDDIEVCKFWIPDGTQVSDVLIDFRPGDDVYFFFNRYGKIAGISSDG